MFSTTTMFFTTSLPPTMFTYFHITILKPVLSIFHSHSAQNNPPYFPISDTIASTFTYPSTLSTTPTSPSTMFATPISSPMSKTYTSPSTISTTPTTFQLNVLVFSCIVKQIFWKKAFMGGWKGRGFLFSSF